MSPDPLAALQRVIRAQKALEAITQCPDVDDDGLRCELVEHHGLVVGTPHRARLADGRTVSW